MNIWIMRHGEASFNAPADHLRPLTDAGQKAAFNQGKWLGEQLVSRGLNLDKIIVSPYLRTQQTFEQLKTGFEAVKFEQNVANVLETWAGITPDGEPEMVANYLAFLKEEGAKNILLISHLPLVLDLAQTLTNYQARIAFHPAVIAEIHWQGAGELVQIQTP